MPAKLKAMQHGLMAKVHGDKFLSFFPVPTKLLLHTLGEQLKSRQPAIREHEQLRVLEQCIHKKLGVNGISRPLSCKMSINLTVGTFEGVISSYIKDSWTQLLDSGLKSAVAPSMPQLPELAAMEAINSELETVQSEYLEFMFRDGSSLPQGTIRTFQGLGLWFMEKNEEQAEKDRATALEKEHQNAKVLQSAKIQRAYIVAERMRKTLAIHNEQAGMSIMLTVHYLLDLLLPRDPNK
ncbi:hypothetical protein EDD15DRAFT_2198313 [Pisolithus albus]|nr:hypothetical protein EDD15DRAFT_2198303 [Pisolithus albus]KAI5989963.1 hypothetical protein EDD15DRAFT_2198313 [Pisolithus albus]